MKSFIVERIAWDAPVVTSAAEYLTQADAERAAAREWRSGRDNTRTVRVLNEAGEIVWLATVQSS